MKRVLVTGGAGFIGANFVHYWLQHHPDDSVLVYDALTYAGNLENLSTAQKNERFQFVQGDICDYDRVFDCLQKHGIDTVVHFAAESHVDRSIVGPDEFIRTNVVGTHVLLKASRVVWSNSGRMRDDVRFHHVSTDEVYGSLRSGEPGFTEETPYAPNSPYAASKAGSDHLVRAYAHTYGLPVTTSNCSNNYGPYHYPEKLIPLMIVNALEGKPLPVYGRGENVRDWLYVEDHCRAIDLVLNDGKPGETYNVGGCNEWRNIDIVELLADLVQERVGSDSALTRRFPMCPAAKGGHVRDLVKFVEDRPGHDWRYAIDATRIRRNLGFIPQETFESGIRKTLNWYLSHESWWRTLLNRS